ncbi:MAG: hypothetical protein JXB05_30655 [Myxococcaceae bacterium]|nr:hypothetical protein [Myxococcaceae bacterium]
MKKLTYTLALSCSLLLISGCRSSRETRDSADASTGAVDTSTGALTGDTPKPAPGAGEGSTTAAQTEAERAAQERCVDTWLSSKKLDRYGNPEGTMYAGGTPLFNEATGESRDRLEYVYERQPEAKQACARAGEAPDPK